MAFSPTLSICFITCSKIRFTDTTNVYSTANEGGWGGINPATGNTVESAIITIADDEGTEFTYDVTSQIPDPVTGDIIFTDYTYNLPDGQYTLTYDLIFDGGASYSYSKTFENSCHFEGCIDKLIALAAKKLCENSCNTDFIDEVLLIEGLLYGYKCAAMHEKTTIKNNINKRLQRFCDLQCDC